MQLIGQRVKIKKKGLTEHRCIENETYQKRSKLKEKNRHNINCGCVSECCVRVEIVKSGNLFSIEQFSPTYFE